MRLFFFLSALPLALFVGLAARRLYSPTAGWIAVLLTLTSVVIAGSARIRHDIGLAWMVALSLWLFAEAVHQRKSWLHAAAGLAMGLGMFAHYHAIGLGVVMTMALYLPRLFAYPVERRENFRAMLFYIVGGIGGALIVVLLQILPQWEAFLRERASRVPFRLDVFIQNFLDHADSIGEHSRFELGLTIIALLGLIFGSLRRRIVDLSLLIACLGGIAALALMARGFLHYIVHIMPLFLVATAGILSRLISQVVQLDLSTTGAAAARFSIVPALIVAVPFAAVMAGEVGREPISVIRRNLPLRLEIPAVATWINENVPMGSTISAPNWYYFWLSDQLRFITPYSVYKGLGNAHVDDRVFYEEWAAISPDVVLSDSGETFCCFAGLVFEPEWLAAQGYQEVVQFETEHGRRMMRVYVHSRIADAVSSQGE